MRIKIIQHITIEKVFEITDEQRDTYEFDDMVKDFAYDTSEEMIMNLEKYNDIKIGRTFEFFDEVTTVKYQKFNTDF
jgi:hypothetical protein